MNIMGILDMVKQTWNVYWGDGYQYVVLLFCVAILLIPTVYQKKWITGYSLVIFFLFACPVTAFIIGKYCIGEEVYWRMFWLLPISVIIACACTEMSLLSRRTGIQIAVILLCAAAIFGTGRIVFRSENFQAAANPHKVPYRVERISEIVNDSRAPGEEVRMASTDAICTYLRVYDASIKQPYGRSGRDAVSKDAKRLYAALMNENPYVPDITELAKAVKCNYICHWAESEQVDQEFAAEGYLFVDKIDAYRIYKYQGIVE